MGFHVLFLDNGFCSWMGLSYVWSQHAQCTIYDKINFYISWARSLELISIWPSLICAFCFRVWNLGVLGSLVVMMKVWPPYLPLPTRFRLQNQMPVLLNRFSMILPFTALLLNKPRKHLMWHEIALNFWHQCYHPHHNKML